MMPQAGDIGFVSQHDFTAWWIRFAQRRKYGKASPAARYNHVFMVIDDAGSIIQADPTGVELGHLSQYHGVDFVIKRPAYGPGEAANAVAAMREQLGTHYGWLTIASVGLMLLTGTRLRFGLAGTEICSGAAAYAMTRANMDCGQDETYDTPADLYSVVHWV